MPVIAASRARAAASHAAARKITANRAGSNPVRSEKGLARDHLAHLGNVAEDHGGSKSELLFESVLDARGQPVLVPRSAPKQHVSTLQQGANVAQPEPFVHRAQRLHPDAMVRPEIDSAQQRNHHHGRKGTTTRTRPGSRERVRRRMRELDYRPNLAARALVTGRIHTVGLVVPSD